MKKVVIIFLVLLTSISAFGIDWYLGSTQGIPYSVLSVTNQLDFFKFLGVRANLSHYFCTLFNFGVDVRFFLPIEEGVRLFGFVGEANIWDLIDNKLHAYFDFGIGTEFRLSDDWRFEFEIGPGIRLTSDSSAPSVIPVSQFTVRKLMKSF